MKIFNKQKNKGFTLVETMVAVFILTTTVMSLLSLTTSSLFAAKYANNEITANYLLQEVVDYIRNNRDSVAFQQSGDTIKGGWNNFINKYGASDNTSCFSSNGCSIDVMKSLNKDTISSSSCPEGICPIFYYNETPGVDDWVSNNFYTYLEGPTFPTSFPTTFRRKIQMKLTSIVGATSSNDELDITVTVDWMNGNLTRSRSLKTSLLNWQN